MKLRYLFFCISVLLLGLGLLIIFNFEKADRQNKKLLDNYFVNSELYGLLKWNIEKHYSFENTLIKVQDNFRR